MACIVVAALTVVDVSHRSVLSAESVAPAVSDHTRVRAAAGQIVTVGAERARRRELSVVVDQVWRAAGARRR